MERAGFDVPDLINHMDDINMFTQSRVVHLQDVYYNKINRSCYIRIILIKRMFVVYAWFLVHMDYKYFVLELATECWLV
jgi:hypothetical protein